MKIIHLSDPHLVRPGDLVYEVDPAERLARCIADINAHHAAAQLCVITGDLVHHGEEVGYGLLRELLGELAVPWQLLIGNHDDRTIFRRVFPEASLDENGFVQEAKTLEDCTLLFLDTAERGTHAGCYCERRQAWLQRALEKAAGRDLMIFMHHPPLRIGIRSLDSICLLPRARLTEMILPYKEWVRLVCFGHVHRPVSGTWRGIPFSGMKGTAYQCLLDFTAINQPPGSHEPPAYGIILSNAYSTVVHAHDFLDAGPHFAFAERPEGDQALSRMDAAE